MYRLSYLMTYRGGDKYRRQNLHFILDQLSLDPTIEVILVEQDVVSQISTLNSPHLTHLLVENPGAFNKSWGLNIAALHASCSPLIFADADIVISSSMIDRILDEMNQGVDAINPYDILIDLTLEESQQLFEENNLKLFDRLPNQINRQSIGQHPPFCGGFFAITRQLYDSSGGLDERFVGWGGEDDAMSLRVKYCATEMKTLNGVGYHLWHEPDKSTDSHPPSYIRNLALLSKYGESSPDIYRQMAIKDSSRNGNKGKYVALSDRKIDDTASLVSCLCVTRGRVSLLSRAIDCFLAQTHENKELIIVCESDDLETVKFLDELKVDKIYHYVVPSDPKQCLGELRNYSIQLAKGEYFCQWDDDDWFHADRIVKQLEALQSNQKAASVLSRWLIHETETDRVLCSNIRLWEGSLLCKKDALASIGYYDALPVGEDSGLITKLFLEDQLSIEDMPHLYVYCITGQNTWHESHLQKILNASIVLNPGDSETVKAWINR